MSDDHIGIKVNGILYIKLDDASKTLRESWDLADARIEELESALKNSADALREAGCNLAWAVANAALEGKKDE